MTVIPSVPQSKASRTMATRPAPAKQAPAKKAAANKPAAAKSKPVTPAPKAKAAAARSKPAVTAQPTKAVAAPVVTLKAVFEQLGEAHALPKKQAHGLLADFVAAMTTHLKQGDRIRMSGLGILEVKTRAARTGRNPATGEIIQIKARKKVGFRPAKELKEAI
jgi:DNA-binding protein HU-beta